MWFRFSFISGNASGTVIKILWLGAKLGTFFIYQYQAKAEGLPGMEILMRHLHLNIPFRLYCSYMVLKTLPL